MSAQDKLDRSAAKHGLGSDERKRKIQKAKDFFSKPVPTYSKDELRKMGHPVEATDAEVKKKQDFLDRLRGKPPVKKEGMFDIPISAPKGSNKNTDKQRAAKAARRAANRAKTDTTKIDKAVAKDKARSASGSLTRTDDHRRKNYQTGKSGAHFSKYESSAEYGKSMDRIRDKEKNAAIKPKDRETLGKLADLMKKQKRNEAYRKPTQAEIDADKRKDGKSKDSSTRYKNMKKKMYGNAMGGLKNEESHSVQEGRKTKRLVFDTISKASKAEKSAKRLKLRTDTESQGGNYYVAATGDHKDINKWVKMSESVDLGEQKYAVKYTHPTDKKSGKTTGPMSKAAADKKAAMGNRVDRVGGKYTVIPHVEAAGQEYTAVPIKTGDVSQADRLTIAKMDAIMKKRSKDKRQKESVNLEENKIFFVKVGDGRDHMTVKVKASNSREALKKMRAQHPKDKVALDQNQKQGRSAGALESVDEATMADRAVMKAVRIAKDMAGNHTGASKRIEKMKKGLSDHPKVKDALRLANESVSSADKKPQNFRDPATGKMKVRMVPVDRDVVRGDDKARVVRKKRFKHMRKEQMATGNSRVGKDGRDAFMKAFKDVQKTAAEIQKKKDADKK
jgi:hypothetical protein